MPMTPTSNLNDCKNAEFACAYALQVLPMSEMGAAEAHIATCEECQSEVRSLGPLLNRFVSWPTDVLRPNTSLQMRLALRIAEDTGQQPVLPPTRQWSEPE